MKLLLLLLLVGVAIPLIPSSADARRHHRGYYGYHTYCGPAGCYHRRHGRYYHRRHGYILPQQG